MRTQTKRAKDNALIAETSSDQREIMPLQIYVDQGGIARIGVEPGRSAIS
jgi:hypothetical protein